MVLDNIFGSYILNSRASSEFSFESAKNKLVNMDLGPNDGNNLIFTTPEDDMISNSKHRDEAQRGVGRKGRLMRLAGWIDLNNRVSVCVLLSSSMSLT
jgi:DNA mismatch repair protein MSH5